MGRHALPRSSPAGPADELLGWGTFATILAAALAGWTGESWTSALPVAGLGSAVTAVLWIGAHVTHLNNSQPEGRRRHGRETGRNDAETGHLGHAGVGAAGEPRAGTRRCRIRRVQWRRDQRNS